MSLVLIIKSMNTINDKNLKLVKKFLLKSKKFTEKDFEVLLKIKEQKIPLSDNLVLKKEWLGKNFNDWKIIDENLPEAWGCRSNFKIKLIHKSGFIKEVNNRNIKYIYGNKKTNKEIIPIRKEILLGRKFGNLKLIDEDLEDFICERSGKKYKFICDCGEITKKVLEYVTGGETKTCGECRKKKINKEEMFSKKYNKLRVLTEEESVFNKNLNLNNEIIYSDNFGKFNKIEVICDCGNKKTTGIYDLLSNRILSCGCSLNESRSNESKLFFDFIKSKNKEAKYSVRGILKNRELDIFIESMKLNIEYHGCHWHSLARRTEEEKLKDFEKYKMLESVGIRSVQIYSDEWREKREIMENYFKNLLKDKDKKRCYKTNICFITFEEAKEFLDRFHYLSGNNHSGTYYIGIYNECNILISVSVFKKLNESEIEWKRFCCHPNFKIWNPGEKTINFIKDLLIKCSYKKIISFSDNRLHSGDIYKKIGFFLEKELQPDYYYTNGHKRIHKFNFRVKAGVDEQEEAKKRNFYRIYDCGKRKWTMILS